MINITSSTYIPRVEETLGTLRMHNSMMPQYVDFDKIMMEITYLQFEIEKISDVLFAIIGKPVKFDASANMKYWLDSTGVNLEAFDRTKTGISLDKDSIAGAIESGMLSEETINVLLIYQKYSVMVHMRGTLISLLQNPMADIPSCDGHKMLILNPHWEPQNTGRVAMQRPAIQNFQHELQELITVPIGYTKLHTDSGQVEPRITYSTFIPDKQIQALINLYNDAYFGLLHYCTMPQSDIMSGRTDFVKMDITEDMQAGRKKIKTYGNAVMYGSKSNPTGDPIKSAMIKRIGEHPLRINKTHQLLEQINRGQVIFKTAFGTPIDISKSPKLSSGKYESVEEQKLKLAINNPIQGTAADLMRISVHHANGILMNRAKKSYIVNYVHDAGIFAIHDSEFDMLKDELADIVSYRVEGWLPIYADPEFGRDGGKHGLIRDLY